MAETNTPCFNTRLAREIAFLRHGRILLVAALACLSLSTIRMTMAAFGPPAEFASPQAMLPGASQPGPAPIAATPDQTQPAGQPQAEALAAGGTNPSGAAKVHATVEVSASRPTCELAMVTPVVHARPEGQPARDLSIAIAATGLRAVETCHRYAQRASETWQKLAPGLDAAVAVLRESGRQAGARPLAPIPDGPGARQASPATVHVTPTESSSSAPQGVVLSNPEQTKGVVNYLVNGQVHSLRPGQREELPAGQSWHIQFHRGDEFGNADQTLTSGTYNFCVGPQGWDLSDTSEASPSTEKRAD